MIRQSVLYFAVRVGNGVFAIAALAVFTRLLSPEEYSVYAFGMAKVSFYGNGVLILLDSVNYLRYG